MSDRPSLEIAEQRLIDDPIAARVLGLAPGLRLRVRASSTDAAGIAFRSWADYRVTIAGTVDLAAQAPLDGTYRGADPYGLWWSMRSHGRAPFTATLAPVTTTLRVEVDAQTVATASWSRAWLGPGVTVRPIGSGLAATLFTPVRCPAPGVIVLGGSDGGRRWAEGIAALLASRGFTALALAYFAEPGLPATLTGVPLEYMGSAVTRLVEEAAVAGDQVVVAGASRGGELALLTGSTFPQVGAVVGWAASGVVWGGLGPTGRISGPAWTHNGAPLSYTMPHNEVSGSGSGARPVVLAPTFTAALDSEDTVAAVPVERISGPVLLVSGGNDQMWPAARLADAVVRRMTQCGHSFGVRHLHYPVAGHLAGRPPGLPALPQAPIHPADGRRYSLGGTPAADAGSAADAWPQVLDFLHRCSSIPPGSRTATPDHRWGRR